MENAQKNVPAPRMTASAAMPPTPVMEFPQSPLAHDNVSAAPQKRLRDDGDSDVPVAKKLKLETDMRHHSLANGISQLKGSSPILVSSPLKRRLEDNDADAPVAKKLRQDHNPTDSSAIDDLQISHISRFLQNFQSTSSSSSQASGRSSDQPPSSASSPVSGGSFHPQSYQPPSYVSGYTSPYASYLPAQVRSSFQPASSSPPNQAMEAASHPSTNYSPSIAGQNFTQMAYSSVDCNSTAAHQPVQPISDPAGKETCTLGGVIVTVITDPSQIGQDESDITLFGLNGHAQAWLKKKVTTSFDVNRTRTYAKWQETNYDLRIYSALQAKQHRDSVWERAGVYADTTLSTVRANDALNAERWYNAAIDLSQMRDKLASRGKAADKFVRMAENGQPFYTPEEITALYFKFMDVVADGTQHGFRVSTNPRHRVLTRKPGYVVNLTATDRLEQALQAIRNEKAIFGDLLGSEGGGNIIEFAYQPSAYADLKKEDRRTNTNRSLPKSQRTKQGDPDVFPWSATPAAQRPPCVYPAWSALPPARRITSAPQAHSFHQHTETSRRATTTTAPSPPPADLHLAHFTSHLDDFARLLADAVTSPACSQDSARSPAAAAFAGAPPEHTTGGWERQTRNVQAWAYRVCERLVEGAAHGFVRPAADGAQGQALLEVDRHAMSKLGQVFGRGDGEAVDVFERFGAVHAAVLCSKAIAAPFRDDVEAFVRIDDLVWEPLAFMETKLSHRKSNSRRKTVGGASEADMSASTAPAPAPVPDPAPTAPASAPTPAAPKKRRNRKRQEGPQPQPQSQPQQQPHAQMIQNDASKTNVNEHDDNVPPPTPQERARATPDYPDYYPPGYSTVPTTAPAVPTEASDSNNVGYFTKLLNEDD
ncbi:replication factor-a protein 1 subfamily protein [Diplodia corticola]|uniref:Replication factor-a protein 1 subfamily protein n=1 Tax=Diplodia corticola TaxID=236234 RepID=A0A1J9RKZ5_9PEZI|nr:replication factor-a protein 1 subfamily protein [Diplodia corticola]OJD40642.1 replication factor-a protein 1 subfamily protein [Diplodia corticola]